VESDPLRLALTSVPMRRCTSSNRFECARLLVDPRARLHRPPLRGSVRNTIKRKKVMKTSHGLPRAAGLATVLLLSACGGGGGSDGGNVAPPPPPPATTTSTVVVGTITGFGSIFVNGIEFATDGASFTVDDNPGVESDLSLGQVVTIVGSLDDNGSTGSADDVIVDDQVEGPIESIDATAGQIVVLGQTVTIDASTVFDDRVAPPSIDGLQVGELVEVSGLRDAAGSIVATRIEPATAGGELEVHGTVSALDTAHGVFSINGLTIDYSTATLDDFPAGAPADGDFVEVHGSGFGAGGELIATRVELEAGPFGGIGDDVQVEVEGLVTRFVSATDFDVAGQAVTTTAGTEFENGVADDVALGVKVEVEGRIDDNGVLVAEKVSLRRENDVRIEGLVDAVDASAGTLSVFGIPVSVDALTRFDDHSDADLREFDLGDLSVGDFVEVRGVEDPDNAVLAAELRRDDADDEITVQGAVDEVTAGESLTLLGVTVVVDGGTQYRDAADNAIGAADFFAAIGTGTSVKAKGADLGGGVLGAEELELEPED
jgi:hypothetical protein